MGARGREGGGISPFGDFEGGKGATAYWGLGEGGLGESGFTVSLAISQVGGWGGRGSPYSLIAATPVTDATPKSYDGGHLNCRELSPSQTLKEWSLGIGSSPTCDEVSRRSAWDQDLQHVPDLQHLLVDGELVQIDYL
ncbi:hypothetical protein TIFTF001_041056 [Ficus carica]|uniref:Uncharacterized protein n=1 Tax=Ficus carica TaxID=3494 RepID=A0AA87Z8J3_FICCA|nr:hypothetical protein TIFTF001_041056 [Ficus carica]